MTKGKIRKGIYNWGIYPTLVILKEEQEKENYKNCQLLKNTLDEVGKGNWGYLNSKVDDDSMNKTYENILKELKKPDGLDFDFYVEELRDYLENG